MNCSELRRYLSLHLDSELSPETAADLVRHAETCPSCADRLHAEERLEHRLREVLRAPAPGDDEAWRRAIASLPRRRRWLPFAAAAALIAAVGAVLFFTRHKELDLAATLAQHHAKYVAGQSPLGVETSDPAEASRYLHDKVPFDATLMGAVPKEMRLVGARLCYLDGAPTAFYIFHRDRSVVTVAVFAADDLSRFPVARERLQHEGEVRCRVDTMAFVLVGDGAHAVSVVGDVPADELSRLARLFLKH